MERSLNPNSSLWDMDYEGLLHSKKPLPGTVGSYKPSSLFRSSPLLSHQGKRSLLSQNLGQKPQEKQLSCDTLLKLSRYILMDTFGPGLAWNLFRFYNCDREVNLPKIRIGPLTVAQRKVKPFLLRRVLRLLRSVGAMAAARQSKAFPHLKKQRKTPRKPKAEQSGRYLKRRHDVGISAALWCWWSGVVGSGSAPPGRGVGPVSCQGPSLTLWAELEPRRSVAAPKREVWGEAAAEQETPDGGRYGGQPPQRGRCKGTGLWESIWAL
ncbi:uncharacterized protein LOC142362535 [Opisthocomus hoazin]|uniref:uncharacterized protein LOC142362535 n=1 Tax=Opisthocomus hoazin TaxID=30419 RepID=UPI003F53DCF4